MNIACKDNLVKYKACTELLIIVLAVIFISTKTASCGADEQQSFIVDGGQPYKGLMPSIQVDDAGLLHICFFNVYYDNSTAVKYADLKYVTFQNGKIVSDWVIDMIYGFDVWSNGGSYLALALDKAGLPHVAYYNGTTKDLKYAYFDNTSWHKETVISGGAGPYVSLALDSNDMPHISYYDAKNASLKYVYNNGLQWKPETVDTPGDADTKSEQTSGVGKYNSLKIDKTGVSHIAYYDEINGNAKYAFKDISGWHLETVDERGNTGISASLDIDNSTNNPHIAYYRILEGVLFPFQYLGLGYKVKVNGEWTMPYPPVFMSIPSFDNTYDAHELFCSLKLDSRCKPRISYFNPSLWRVELTSVKVLPIKINLDPAPWANAGPYNCLAIDKNDTAYIAIFAR